MYTRGRGLGACVIDDEGVQRCDEALPPCATMPAVPKTFQGPFACSGNQSDVPRFDASGQPASQAGLDAIWQFILSQQPVMKPEYSFTDFLATNWKPLAIGGAIFVGLLMVTRR